jgi:hypothetical protein
MVVHRTGEYKIDKKKTVKYFPLMSEMTLILYNHSNKHDIEFDGQLSGAELDR